METTVIEAELKYLTGYALKKVEQAAKRSAVVQIDHYNSILQRLNVISDQFKSADLKLAALRRELNRAESGPAPSEEHLRVLSIRLTAGMIDNHMLVVTPYEAQLGYGESMTVVTDFSRFTTNFVKAGNKLKERGKIRAFYAKRGVKPGDEVVLEEYAKGRWYLDTRKERQNWRTVVPLETTAGSPLEHGVKLAPAEKPEVYLRPKLKPSET